MLNEGIRLNMRESSDDGGRREREAYIIDEVDEVGQSDVAHDNVVLGRRGEQLAEDVLGPLAHALAPARHHRASQHRRSGRINNPTGRRAPPATGTAWGCAPTSRRVRRNRRRPCGIRPPPAIHTHTMNGAARHAHTHGPC